MRSFLFYQYPLSIPFQAIGTYCNVKKLLASVKLVDNKDSLENAV